MGLIGDEELDVIQVRLLLANEGIFSHAPKGTARHTRQHSFFDRLIAMVAAARSKSFVAAYSSGLCVSVSVLCISESLPIPALSSTCRADEAWAKNSKFFRAVASERLPSLFSSTCVLFPPDLQQQFQSRAFAVLGSQYHTQLCSAPESLVDTQRQLAVEIERYTQRLQQLRDKVRSNRHISVLVKAIQVQRNRTNPALDYQHTAKRLSVSLVTFTQLIEGRSLHCRVVAHAPQTSSNSMSTTGTSMCGSMPRLPRRSGLSAARRSRPSPCLPRIVTMAVSLRHSSEADIRRSRWCTQRHAEAAGISATCSVWVALLVEVSADRIRRGVHTEARDTSDQARRYMGVCE
jgi:hypothetical protein